MEGMEIVPIFLHIYSTASTTTLSPFYPHASLLIPTMWYLVGEKVFISGCECGLPRTHEQNSLQQQWYQSGINKAELAIGERWGSDHGEQLAIVINCEK